MTQTIELNPVGNGRIGVTVTVALTADGVERLEISRGLKMPRPTVRPAKTRFAP